MINIPPLITNLTYVRDTITINEAFLAELTAQIDEKNLNAGSTITIAARVITHAPNYVLRLTNYKLIVIAEEYDAAGGSIDVSGSAGANGAKGVNGEKDTQAPSTRTAKTASPEEQAGTAQPARTGCNCSSTASV